VVLFEKSQKSRGAGNSPMDKRQPPAEAGPRSFEYRYLTEFQSHEPEFDYLKSLEIEERINKVKWCRQVNGANYLLSTNDKTVKLWKVYEKSVKYVTNFNLPKDQKQGNSISRGEQGKTLAGFKTPKDPEVWDSLALRCRSKSSVLRLPSVNSSEVVFSARCRRVYSNAHTYHINSIATCSDNDTFISADDLRINVWNYDVTDTSFNVVDMKPTNMEDLTEVITSADFHPSHCNLFLYSSSKGSLRLVDMRDSALCDGHCRLFEEQEAPGTRSFFSEIIASVSDAKFTRNGRYIVSRDYMTLKVWDVNMERGPVTTFNVHEQLRSKLCDLYENDSIFDKFECCASGDGALVASGSYKNVYKVFNTHQNASETLEASRTPLQRKAGKPKSPKGLGILRRRNSTDQSAEQKVANDAKLLHLAWHPENNVIACASANSLYLHYAP